VWTTLVRNLATEVLILSPHAPCPYGAGVRIAPAGGAYRQAPSEDQLRVQAVQARDARISVIEDAAKSFAASAWRALPALLLAACFALLPQGRLFAAAGPTRIQSNTAKGNYTAS